MNQNLLYLFEKDEKIVWLLVPNQRNLAAYLRNSDADKLWSAFSCWLLTTSFWLRFDYEKLSYISSYI